MEESKLATWIARIAAAVIIGLGVGLFVGAFRGSTVIAEDLLTPQERHPGPAFEVELVGSGRIILPRNDLTERPGVWGVVNGDGAYGQMAAVISQDAETVERSFRTLTGRFIAGDQVTLDAYAAADDPMEAFAIEYENVRIPGNLGVNPAWYIDGPSDTWVIVVHGEGLDERAQALRVLPVLQDGGFPTLVITYRNDSAAPDDGGYYRWGLSEWQDIDAAMTFARNRDQDADFILYGFGMGANIATMHLHESERASEVRGAILDSVVVDLGSVVDRIAEERGIPGVVKIAAKAVARIRFGLEWSELNQFARADQFDIPMLLMHGTEDHVAPIAETDQFIASVAAPMTYERFEGAGRAELWNSDPDRYNELVLGFLLDVVAN